MVTLPDGAQIDMQWKSVKYANKQHNIVFEIIPMMQESDVVLFPNKRCWKKIAKLFSNRERMEIIFLLEKIAWKRDIRVAEVDIMPEVDQETAVATGTLEATDGYQKISSQCPFDPQSSLTKEQAKELYCILEKRFAEGVSGIVEIPKSVVIRGSVLEGISIPTLKENKNVQLNLYERDCF